MTKYILHIPTPKQAAFLLLDCRDAFYGGAAGGGKSDALLMGALQYVDVPGYAALLIRATYKDLSLPGAIMERAKDWLMSTDAHWNENAKTWTFPGGAQLVFGYLDGPNDHYQYDSSEFQYIGIDEITKLRMKQATYLFSRLRRLKGVDIPIRYRTASNPGGRSHNEVKKRYVDPRTRGDRVFIPAGLDDNPYLDKEEYEKSLDALGIDSPIVREQLKKGDWDIREQGRMFDRSWFPIVDVAPAGGDRVRYWDMAATEPKKKNREPDWTAGCRMVRTNDGRMYIEDMVHVQKRPRDTEREVKQRAVLDGVPVDVWMEQEGGASGKIAIDHYTRNVLPGWTFKGDPVATNKAVRAKPLSSQAQAGNVYLVSGRWIEPFLDELDLFPDGDHDDQVDAASGAFSKLCQQKKQPRARYV